MSDVFISYSRKDIAFARLIQKSLQQSQVDTWIDWERIPVGEKWWTEICDAIQNANVFMFIISRNSIGSPVCKDEIDQALKNNKRIIPILVDDLKPDDIKEFAPDLPQFNWIIFEKDQIFRIEENPQAVPGKPEDSQVALPLPPRFEDALGKLSQAIHTDWDWVKYHTRLQVNALLWEGNQRNPGYLVRGAALEEAEQQLLLAGAKDPRPTSLQAEFVSAGRKEETLRQQERLKLEQRARQRQRWVLWAVGTGLAVALILGIIALGQRNEAIDQSNNRATAEVNANNQRETAQAASTQAVSQQATAQAASTLAIEQRNEAERQARLALSGQLSTQSQTQLTHQLDLAMLLAGESFLTADTYHSRSSLLLALEQSPQLARIFRFPEKITALAFSPDGKWITAAGCARRDSNQDVCLENTLTFYDLVTGKIGRTLQAKGGRLTGLAFTPDGEILFAAIANDRIYRYNLSAADQTLPTPLPIFEYSSGTVIVSPDGKYMVSGGCDYFSIPGGLCGKGGIVLWDLHASVPSGTALKGVAASMHDLAFSPKGDQLYAGDCASILTETYGKTSLDRCQAGEIRVWNLADGGMQEHPVDGATSAIISVDISADGSLLAAGEASGVIHVIDLGDWKQVAKHTMKSQIDSVLFSSAGEGDVLAALSFGNPIAMLFATSPGNDPVTLEPYQSTRFVDAMAINPDGRILASSSCAAAGESMSDCKQGEIYLWNLFSWQPTVQTYGDRERAEWNNWQIGFDPASAQVPIVVAASASRIDTWDLEKNQPSGRPFIEGQDLDWSSIQLSHSGKVLAYPDMVRDSGNNFSTQMHFWDVPTRQAAGTPVTVDGSALNLLFSPDDRWMVSDGPEGMLLVWDPTTGQVAREMKMDLNPGFIELAFSPDGKTLAAAGCIKGFQSCQTYRIEIFDPETGQAAGKPIDGSTNGSVIQLVFSPDGKSIGISTHVSTNQQESWYNIQTGQPDPKMSGLAVGQFSPDGRGLVSTTCEWGTWGGISSSCGAGVITLWDVQKQAILGQPIRNLDGNTNFLGFSPDGRSLYTYGIGKMTVWSLDPQDWLQRICQVANRDLTAVEWATYLGDQNDRETCPGIP
jgi:WD40 repeat protein